MAIGGDSSSRDREIEYRHRILDGYIFAFICCNDILKIPNVNLNFISPRRIRKYCPSYIVTLMLYDNKSIYHMDNRSRDRPQNSNYRINVGASIRLTIKENKEKNTYKS